MAQCIYKAGGKTIVWGYKMHVKHVDESEVTGFIRDGWETHPSAVIDQLKNDYLSNVGLGSTEVDDDEDYTAELERQIEELRAKLDNGDKINTDNVAGGNIVLGDGNPELSGNVSNEVVDDGVIVDGENVDELKVEDKAESKPKAAAKKSAK